jgi:hypothetical protein
MKCGLHMSWECILSALEIYFYTSGNSDFRAYWSRLPQKGFSMYPIKYLADEEFYD